jgi:hypothetical protein
MSGPKLLVFNFVVVLSIAPAPHSGDLLPKVKVGDDGLAARSL